METHASIEVDADGDGSARERERLLTDLADVGVVLPEFAQQIAGARRQAAQLRRENDSLVQQVRRLQRARAALASRPKPLPR